MSKTIKAVALISGGLDSMLATKLMLEQGIHVEGLNFYTGFCLYNLWRAGGVLCTATARVYRQYEQWTKDYYGQFSKSDAHPLYS